MSKTLVIGANGQIGAQLVSQLREANQPVRVMLRDDAQRETFESRGAEVQIADLESELPDAAFAGCDKVVFTAGSGAKTGADKTILVDLWGACKAIDMAKKHAVKQFVLVSSRDAGSPDSGTPKIKHYNVCKHFADQYLLHSGVPFTILRPGLLTNDEAAGTITTSRPAGKEDQFITRTDTAACIAHCLQTPSTINQIRELYQGSIAIEQALV